MSEKYMEDFQALVSQGDINSPVSGVALTAIGYVGEKLHIQIRYDSALETDNHGYVYLKNSDGDVLDCEASISFFTDEGEKICTANISLTCQIKMFRIMLFMESSQQVICTLKGSGVLHFHWKR